MELDLQTSLIFLGLFNFALVGLWFWAIHFGPLRGE